MKKIFVVKEKVDYEGDNIWIYAADSAEEIKKVLKQSWKSPTWWNTTISEISNTSEYTETQELWSN